MENYNWALLEEADWLFRKMVRRFVKERDKISIEGIALPGLLILNIILRDGEQRLGDLAEQLDFTSGAVTALCDKLEESGLAVRKRSEQDRRAVVLEITDKGKEMLNRNHDVGLRSITTLFAGFSAEQLTSQINGYRQMIENLEGFSDAMLSLAKQNAEKVEREQQAEQKRRSERFISY
ncbi:MarR family winged helix-turn-helix transcriptional regulator [Candidatus Pristimantibacillus sp. PTI5]|uniref:MarR family winged helix-turn-helix transcriptional regulator n=1 Tax=Candidatus Pristimantibacillus sp. PTI5 TaxID=3400422 RepID=UPI003B013367